jgi:transcriptional regulator with XRE-family HTH domain
MERTNPHECECSAPELKHLLREVSTVISGGELRAWRRARGWDVPELARQLRRASAEPLPKPESLEQMIRAWERGNFRPSERYRLLLAKLFPGKVIDGDPAAGLAALAGQLETRLDAMPGPAQISALEAAALARMPAGHASQVHAWAAELADHMEQAREIMQQIADAFRPQEEASGE